MSNSTPPSYAPPKRRRIYLMRHGSVHYFDAHGVPVPPETATLSEEGLAQASAAGRAFAAQNVRFDRVIVSGLPRTVETAKLVLSETGQAIDLEVFPDWQEIRGGNVNEIPNAQLHDAFIAAFEGIVPEDTRFLGGETIGHFLDRVLPGVAQLRADPHWDTALLVLHGGTNRALLSHALTAGLRLFLGNIAQTAGCINALDVGDAPHDWVVRMVNHSPPTPLHDGWRQTTMEAMLEHYVAYRQAQTR